MRKVKRLFAFILCLAMILSCFGISDIKAQAKESGLRGDNDNPLNNIEYIYFGSYPQELVDTDSIIEAIDGKLGDNNVGDCWIDGIKYSKKYDIYDECVYFKWNRIKWNVLKGKNEEGDLYYYMVADKALDVSTFEIGSGDITWKNSKVRSFLNGYDGTENAKNVDYSAPKENFVDIAFSEEEKECLTTLDIFNIREETVEVENDMHSAECLVPGGTYNR